jgi:hypothetical protein
MFNPAINVKVRGKQQVHQSIAESSEQRVPSSDIRNPS